MATCVSFYGSKPPYFEVKENVPFPGVHAEFALVEKKGYETQDYIFFDSTTPDSFFSQVGVDFELKSITVATEDSNLSDKFRSYFLREGFDGDSIHLCIFTAEKKLDLQKLCKILLNNNTFPEKWVPFFESILKDGTWTISSKEEISKL